MDMWCTGVVQQFFPLLRGWSTMPRPKVFTVALPDTDRAELTRLVGSGVHPARMIMRARVLLELDENAGPSMTER